MSGVVDISGNDADDWDVVPVSKEPAGEASTLCFANVNEFVQNYLIKVYRRRIINGGPHRWAARWWENEEAIARLTALWRAFEQYRLDPGAGMSTWWNVHADPTMRTLLATDGPFAGSRDTNDRGDPLPYEPPPPGLF